MCRRTIVVERLSIAVAPHTAMSSAPARLRSLLARPGCHLMPCCFDPLSARLVEASGFPVTFASGFSVAAAHGLPDTGLLSYGEMEHAMRRITGSLKAVPCIGDGDTGYGNAVNAKRTARAASRRAVEPPAGPNVHGRCRWPATRGPVSPAS